MNFGLPRAIRKWAASTMLLFAASALAQSDTESLTTLRIEPGKFVILSGGKLFTEYVFTNTSRPYFYPVYGPGGVAMTRNWPLKEAPGEEHDHPHHRSLWFSHGSVNGLDFWSELPGAGRIIQTGFEASTNGGKAILRTSNEWIATNGSVVCTDERTITFFSDGTARILDFEITIRASNGPLEFGDTKEGTMAIRLAETMRLKGEFGEGHIVNSRGERDSGTWGKRAEWCDYFGPVQGKTVGVAIFDHPSNLRHPTWWHVRDYGLFAANPFGKHDFESLEDKKAGNLKIGKGESIKLQYRFYFHQGDDVQGKIKKAWSEYARQASLHD